MIASCARHMVRTRHALSDQEADQSAPQRRRGYYYYTRTEEGKQYAVHCRRRVPDSAPARPSGVLWILVTSTVKFPANNLSRFTQSYPHDDLCQLEHDAFCAMYSD